MSKDSEASGQAGGAASSGQGPEAGPQPGDERNAPDPLGLDDAADAAAAVPAGGGGRALGALALLLALAACGGAAYLYYELIHRGEDRTGALAGRIDAVQATLEDRLAETRNRFDAELGALAARQQRDLDSFAERQEAARRAADAALEAALVEVARQGPPSSGDWRQAEAQYLLRIANHRLLMERDVAGALQLLRAADATLAELDNFALHPVRAGLADEIAALEAVRDVDMPGLFLRLEAAKRDLAALPLRVPEYRRGAAPAPEPAAPEPAADQGVLAELQRQLRGLLRVRRLESDAKPLLAPEESLYLELNLRLMLERAQLAAMNRDQLVFQESLASAADWMRRYLLADDPAVARLLEELAALQAQSLSAPLPDVSGSLNALQQLERPPQ